MNMQLLFWAVLAVAAGAALVWAFLALRSARGEAEGWRTRHETLQLELARASTLADRLPVLEGELKAVNDELVNQKTSNAALMMRVQEQALGQQEKIAALTDVKSGIETNLKAMAAEVLQSSQGTFLELANQAFEKHKVGAEADLEARQKAVEKLVAPLQETLASARQQIDQLERNRAEAYGALSGQLRSMVEAETASRTETAKLTQALRASPKTRGRWGEHALTNVLELSGLSRHCDFQTEASFERRDGRFRPDAVIRMPGGRSLIVDAKTSTSAYLDSVEAVTEEERERHLVLHAAKVRDHAKKLASKNYWDYPTETADFVVMFIPGENFYAAAVERDPDLFQDALAQRVLIATPTNLIALAQSVALCWRQEKVAETARQVHELGRELYRRITVMAEHIQACGGSLTKSVKCFNEFIGSLEQSVMPQARRFNELEVEGAADEIPALKPIELHTRLLRTDRDFAPSLPASANGEAGSPATAA